MTMVTLALLAALTALPHQVQTGRIPSDTGWAHVGDSRVESFQGQPVIQMSSGAAFRRDVSLQDGTIEFDMMVTRARSFVYVVYRMASDEDFEAIYFRPHKSSLPDAVQYDPVWHRESNWQLYHGPGATAPLDFTPGEWMHLRIVLQGSRGAIFVGRDTTPVMIMALARAPGPGYIAFASEPGRDTTGREPLARFANLVVRKDDVTYTFPPEARPAPREGLVTRWQLSAPFVTKPGPMEALPDSFLVGRVNWPAFTTEPNGVLVVGRHLPRPRGPASGVIARLLIRAPTDRLQRLRLGFSDCVTVFVNGRPVFAGDARFGTDSPRQEGVIGEHQALVWLSLKAGENEVLFALTDVFGGRGLLGRLELADGARLVAARR